MDENAQRMIVAMCAMWGAGLSTILGGVKLWETFWRDRVRLTTRYSFTGQIGAADEITIVNLSATPVQVSHWTLAWKPNLLRWNAGSIDVTPDAGTAMFNIAPRDRHILRFRDDDKFDWSHRSAQHRQLYLTLHIFGRRPIVLKVGAGQ